MSVGSFLTTCPYCKKRIALRAVDTAAEVQHFALRRRTNQPQPTMCELTSFSRVGLLDSFYTPAQNKAQGDEVRGTSRHTSFRCRCSFFLDSYYWSILPLFQRLLQITHLAVTSTPSPISSQQQQQCIVSCMYYFLFDGKNNVTPVESGGSP